MKKHTNRWIKICCVGIVIVLVLLVGFMSLKQFSGRSGEETVDMQKKVELPILISGGDASWKSFWKKKHLEISRELSR